MCGLLSHNNNKQKMSIAPFLVMRMWIRVQAFVTSIRTAAETMDGALIAALKKLEMTVTGLTLLSRTVAGFVAHYFAYVQLFATPGLCAPSSQPSFSRVLAVLMASLPRGMSLQARNMSGF